MNSDNVTYDLQKTCRTCLKNTDLMNNIYNKNDNSISLAQMIMTCTSLNVIVP